jgi:hypothetical protein
MFWQVVGAADIPAIELIRQLNDKGFQTRQVFTPGGGSVRVMVGPYADEGPALRAKAALEAAGFHVVRQW